MIRWGIAGTGKIAHTFADDLALCDGNTLVAVGSRAMETANAFARQYDAEYAHDSYDALFENPNVDVVYIASPHTAHAQMAVTAMKKGKHVLCEKPLGMNGNQVETILDTAQEQGVFLMEALWSRFNPTIMKAKELVDMGHIGTLGYLHADFSFYGLDRDEKGRILNPDLGGGSILDIGIYPIFLSYLLLGMPKNIMSSSRFHHTGVEIQTSIIFDYENAQSILHSGLNANSEMKAEIAGSTGTIFIEPRWHEATALVLERNGERQHMELEKVGRGYAHEIKEVQACLEAGKLQSDLWSHKNSRDLCALLDRVRQESGVTFPFEQD